MAKRHRLLKGLGILVLLAVVGLGALVMILRHPLPTGGVSGPEADAAAHAVEKAIDLEAWNRIGAVRFTFEGGGKVHHIVWDRKRNTANLQWKNNEVHLDVAKQTGRAFVGGVEQSGDAQKSLVEMAYKIFVNDTFWLNPLAKLFDEGVSREKFTVDGKPALLVSYASGGVTPGDKYLWMLGDDGMPRAWRLWVSILKIKGIEISWEGWTTLPGGAKVSTIHKILGRPAVKISDLAVADTYDQLPK
jgi:hypothetical protein